MSRKYDEIFCRPGVHTECWDAPPRLLHDLDRLRHWERCLRLQDRPRGLLLRLQGLQVKCYNTPAHDSNWHRDLGVGVFDMPNPNQYDILSIFCKILLSISISIFLRMAISISIFFKLSLSISISISIFSKFPYRYFYRYLYFPNFLIDIFSISIFSK